jgi:hypothetical protein
MDPFRPQKQNIRGEWETSSIWFAETVVDSKTREAAAYKLFPSPTRYSATSTCLPLGNESRDGLIIGPRRSNDDSSTPRRSHSYHVSAEGAALLQYTAHSRGGRRPLEAVRTISTISTHIHHECSSSYEHGSGKLMMRIAPRSSSYSLL